MSGFYSSPNDLGGAAVLANSTGTPAYVDNYVYKGALFAAPDPAKVAMNYSPSSPPHKIQRGGHPSGDRATPTTTMPRSSSCNIRRTFSSSSYLRLFGYSEYSDWFINGPVSAFLTYGGELQDYEVHGNAFGTTAIYSNQLNAKNLLTFTGSYQTQKLETYSGNNYGGSISTNLVDAKGNCYSPKTGYYASCYTPIYNGDGTVNPSGGLNQYGFFAAPAGGFPGSTLAIGTPPGGTPAARNAARNLVTDDGQSAQIDEITPFYSAASLTDEFHPTERLTLNAGLRLENYTYRLDDTPIGVSGAPVLDRRLQSREFVQHHIHLRHPMHGHL